MQLTENGFGEIANVLNDAAREVCGGRILYILEGGYNLNSLVGSVAVTIETTVERRDFSIEEEQSDDYEDYRNQALEHLGQWRI